MEIAETKTSSPWPRLSYDANGNILGYLRNGYSGKLAMDSLSYEYNRDGSGNLLNNQLVRVRDTVAASRYNTLDIDDQAAGNYSYDAIGNLSTDKQTTIIGIDWTVYGKIRQISRLTGGSISYTYDASGNRISKTVGSQTTCYVRDAQGNTLSVYEVSGSNMKLREQNIYGSSQMGVFNRNLALSSSLNLEPVTVAGIGDIYSSNMYRHQRQYELSNHLGNVLVTISDKKVWNSFNNNFDTYLIGATDYYAFGQIMPGRSYNAGSYRYGFNGKENDNEVKGTGNQQDYGMRIYDPRVGRFLSVDPLTQSFPWYTPYQFAGNMPTIAIDLDGAEPIISPKTYGEMKDPMLAVKGAGEIIIDKSKKLLSSMGNTFLGMVGGALQPLDAGHYGDKVSKDRWAQTFPMLPNNNIIKDLVVPAVMAPADVANRIRNNPFDAESWGEAAAIIALARGGSFLGKFKSADFGLKVDLMGGEHSRYGKGYINFDKNAKSGIQADITEFKNHFGDNTISEMIVDNPQAPFLENVTGAIQSGGTITIRGGMSNRNFNSVFNGKAPGLDAFDVISKKENVANPGYKQNDGKTSVGGEINEIILRKKQ